MIGLAACEPGTQEGMDAEGPGEVNSSATPEDPRFEYVSASYEFDSGCALGESTGMSIRLHAIDAPITVDDVELLEYSVQGYMSGDEGRIWWADEERFPIEPGQTLEVMLYDDRSGGVGECGDFDPDVWDAPFRAKLRLFDTIIVVQDVASLGCGWSECTDIAPRGSSELTVITPGE